jgi:hypothetical protein
VHQEDEAVSVAVTEVAEAVREDSAAVDGERHEVAEGDSRLEEEGDTKCGEGERLRRGSIVGSRNSGFGCRTRYRLVGILFLPCIHTFRARLRAGSV